MVSLAQQDEVKERRGSGKDLDLKAVHGLKHRVGRTIFHDNQAAAVCEHMQHRIDSTNVVVEKEWNRPQRSTRCLKFAQNVKQVMNSSLDDPRATG